MVTVRSREHSGAIAEARIRGSTCAGARVLCRDPDAFRIRDLDSPSPARFLRTRCDASYLPQLDRLIVMAHGDAYWHGHPRPLACPEGRFRATVAAYYYVAAPSPADVRAHGAIWAS